MFLPARFLGLFLGLSTLLAESEEELKSLLIKVKEESQKVGLKLNIQKTKIVASGPITSWEIDGETVEAVSDFTFLGSKITADGDCSHEIQRHLLLGRKVMINIDSILKSRDITLPTKVHLVKAMVFPVVTYGCESWTVRKVERWRTDAFELWCWRRLLRVPWTARRSNPSILKEISPGVHWKDWCWGWNSSTLATWCEKLTHWKRPWFWEGLGERGEGDDRGWDGCMATLTRWTWVWVNSGSWWWTGRPGMLWFMGSQRVRHNWMTELNWTELICQYSDICLLAICDNSCIFHSAQIETQNFIWLYVSLIRLANVHSEWRLTYVMIWWRVLFSAVHKIRSCFFIILLFPFKIIF